MNWQATFRRSAAGVFTVAPLAASTFGNAVGPFEGAPNDPRFSRVLTAPQARNCNDVANAETTSANVRQSRHWADFDVTK